jgi:hypothetical protein
MTKQGRSGCIDKRRVGKVDCYRIAMESIANVYRVVRIVYLACICNDERHGRSRRRSYSTSSEKGSEILIAYRAMHLGRCQSKHIVCKEWHRIESIVERLLSALYCCYLQTTHLLLTMHILAELMQPAFYHTKPASQEDVRSSLQSHQYLEREGVSLHAYGHLPYVQPTSSEDDRSPSLRRAEGCASRAR